VPPQSLTDLAGLRVSSEDFLAAVLKTAAQILNGFGRAARYWSAGADVARLRSLRGQRRSRTYSQDTCAGGVPSGLGADAIPAPGS
jgi:hypothetical protein